MKTSLIIFMLTFPLLATAASFDCDRAKGCVENVICQSPQLSQMDSEMANLYFMLRNFSSRRGARALLTSQRNWLTKRNTCNCDANCLVGYYNSRIDQLNSVINESD